MLPGLLASLLAGQSAGRQAGMLAAEQAGYGSDFQNTAAGFAVGLFFL
jgi:hypothetical protein